MSFRIWCNFFRKDFRYTLSNLKYWIIWLLHLIESLKIQQHWFISFNFIINSNTENSLICFQREEVLNCKRKYIRQKYSLSFENENGLYRRKIVFEHRIEKFHKIVFTRSPFSLFKNHTVNGQWLKSTGEICININKDLSSKTSNKNVFTLMKMQTMSNKHCFHWRFLFYFSFTWVYLCMAQTIRSPFLHRYR